MTTLYGMRILEDPNMLMVGDPRYVRRTWKKRLFTLPWKPWIKTTTVVNMIPNPDVIQWEGKLIMHPETRRKLTAEIERQRMREELPKGPDCFGGSDY